MPLYQYTIICVSCPMYYPHAQGMYLSRLKRYAKNSMPDKAVRAAETVKRARRANQSRKPPDDVARVCALVTNLVHYTLVRVQAICT